MANERDAWLDRDAAERLLRGEPVTAAGEPVPAQAERLVGALRDAAAVTYANDAELPGEAAALAAFRQARQLTRPRLTRPSRLVRPGRLVRAGLAAVVVGCALSGMAVATGAGALPSLFRGERGPMPANSVSAVASPGPVASGPSDRGRAPARPAGPDTPGTSGTSSTAGALGRHPAGQGSPAPSSSVEPGGGDTGDEPDPPIGPVGEYGDWSGVAQGAEADAWYRDTLRACRDYRSGEIDPERKDALESAAEGARGAERFCERMLDAAGRGGGAGDSWGVGDSRGAGGKGGGGGSPPPHTALPPVSWTPYPYEPAEPMPTWAPGPSGPPTPLPDPDSDVSGPSPF
ncbi:hypothetical protein [Streptomyces sp. NPDC051569]|uniref:hypothetical protein n=1 Tax=Streptomyces sp. NPDC051569 TaxID=3365661 RepID=UPI0037976DDD